MRGRVLSLVLISAVLLVMSGCGVTFHQGGGYDLALPEFQPYPGQTRTYHQQIQVPF